MLDRRRFLGLSAVSLAFGGLRLASGSSPSAAFAPPGRSNALPLALPPGFEQVVFSRHGEEMDDGLLVPGLHDGMGAFRGRGGTVVLVRNHEVIRSAGPEFGPFGAKLERLDRLDRSLLFDAGRRGLPELGGTTTLVFDPTSRRLVRHALSLGGTSYNCAGGETPWSSWISCEEWTGSPVSSPECDYAVEHGWCFEIPADSEPRLLPPLRLASLGRFRHEAVAVAPDGSAVYLTEDMPDGCLYRFLPERAVDRLGGLAEGGRLQALCAIDRPSLDSRNWPESPAAIRPGERLAVRWIDLSETHAPKDDLRLRAFEAGAIRFARGEGAWHGGDAVYVAATTGGPKQLGQVWRYRPSPQEGKPGEQDAPATLELFIESGDRDLLKNCDNVTIAPWGDLFLCEDGEGRDGLVRVTPQGAVSRFALNVADDGELAGACFSPDGRWLFVNLQRYGATVGITGPWESLRSS